MRLLFLLCVLIPCARAGAQPLGWSALPDAFGRGQVVLVYASAPWCGPCVRMEDDVFPLMRPLLDRFARARLTVDDRETYRTVGGRRLSEADWARHLGIDATPGFAFLAPDGTVLTRVEGYQTPERFALLLAYVATDAYRHVPFDVYVRRAGTPSYSH